MADDPVDHLRAVVLRRFGLHFDADRQAFLAEVLAAEAGSLRPRDTDPYLHRVEADAALPELHSLIERLTINETHFFRHPAQLDAFADVALPERLAARSQSGTLRILSAACSSGEETYTLAMILRDRLPQRGPWNVSIEGVDLNGAVLEKAARARYSDWSLRDTPPALRERHFRRQGNLYAVREEVRAMVSFHQRNLAEDDPSFWMPGAFDVIFCRNAVMYFTPEVTRTFVARVARSLAPGGFFFLGHAETLRGVSDAFDLRHAHGAFFHQLRAGAPARRTVPPAAAEAEAAPSARTLPRLAVAAPSAKPPSRPTLIAPRPSTPAWESAPVLELLRAERFGEAQRLLEAAPATEAERPDVRRLRATLLALAGTWGPAEALCREVIAIDPRDAQAHHILALCREGAGLSLEAMEFYGAAAEFDPVFAFPRLRLGLLARAAGASGLAQQMLGAALPLLETEDDLRLLLFGGGFSREALAALCRTELAAAGALS